MLTSPRDIRNSFTNISKLLRDHLAFPPLLQDYQLGHMSGRADKMDEESYQVYISDVNGEMERLGVAQITTELQPSIIADTSKDNRQPADEHPLKKTMLRPIAEGWKIPLMCGWPNVDLNARNEQEGTIEEADVEDSSSEGYSTADEDLPRPQKAAGSKFGTRRTFLGMAVEMAERTISSLGS